MPKQWRSQDSGIRGHQYFTDKTRRLRESGQFPERFHGRSPDRESFGGNIRFALEIWCTLFTPYDPYLQSPKCKNALKVICFRDGVWDGAQSPHSRVIQESSVQLLSRLDDIYHAAVTLPLLDKIFLMILQESLHSDLSTISPHSPSFSEGHPGCCQFPPVAVLTDMKTDKCIPFSPLRRFGRV